MVFESWLTPHQEGDEEANTPSSVPKQFRSQTPSLSRAEREAAGHRGHGQLRFSKVFRWRGSRASSAVPYGRSAPR